MRLARAVPRLWARTGWRYPGLAVALSYVILGLVVLAPSIRPGRTLVATDLLTIVTPYSALPGAAMGHNPLLSDIAYQFYPWFSFIGQALHHGHIPQWNPAILGGVAATPNGYVSLYYPPTWLAAVLSPFVAYNAFVAFHLVFGALGTYAFSRVVGARRSAAWVAGFLAFTAAFWVHWSLHLVHLGSFVWLPWVLAAAHCLVVAPSPRRVALLGAVYGVWWLGGNPQYVYDGTAVLVVYVVGLSVLLAVRGDGDDGQARAKARTRALLVRLGAMGAALVIGLALAAPVLLPSVATSGRILRSREPTAPNGAVPRSEAIRVLVPDATGSPPDRVLYGSNDELRMDSPFVGVTGFLLAIAALGGCRRRSRRSGTSMEVDAEAEPVSVRLLLVGMLAAVGILAYSTPIHHLLYAVVPGYDRFRAVPARWFSVLPALALPLAALGLDDLVAGIRRSRLALAVAAVASVGAIGVWFAGQATHVGAPRRFFAGRALEAVVIVAVVLAAGWMARRRPAVAVVVLAACVMVEVGINTTRWYPSVDTTSAYPVVAASTIVTERGGRVVRVGERTTFGPLGADVPMVYGGSDADGQGVFLPRDYDRYRRLIDDYGSLGRDLNAIPPLVDGNLVASPLLDALDVRTIVADPGVAVPADYAVVDAGPPVVYARPSPGPAVVVPAATPVTSEGAWAAVGAQGWNPSSTTAVVGLRTPVAGGPGTVAGGGRGPDRERWTVDAPAGGFLRVSANWDRGWAATVDGRGAAVLRADAIFRGVVVGPGHHVVEFSYRNPAEHDGRIVALVSLVVMVLLGSAAAVVRPSWPGIGRRVRLDGERQ